MNKAKISIIVPAYNNEEYIERTVQSICNQTYQNIEIILVNDGSKDNTGQLLNKLALQDERIRVVHKENGGVTSARLRGVEEATGEWIGFVDGDDYIEPQMYEILLENAVKYNVEISHCGYQMVFPNRVDMYYGTGRLVEQDARSGVVDLLEARFVEPGLCNKLYNKSLFLNIFHNQKMDLTIRNNEDLLMNYFLFSKSRKSVFLDECPYHYMVRKGSAATAEINENKLRDPLKVLDILEKETQKDSQLQLIVKRRIVAQLIHLSSMELGDQAELINLYRNNARKELRKRLPYVIKEDFSLKQKIMALVVWVMPEVYGKVHRFYSKITGLDKKYEVN